MRFEKMIHSIIMKICLLLLIVLLSNANIGYPEDIAPVEIGTEYYISIIPSVTKFIEAVTNKDYETLISLSDKNSRQWLTKLFDDKNSVLHYHLYIHPNSAYNIITKSKQLEIKMLRSVGLESRGRGTYVCFHDKSKIPLVWNKQYIFNMENPVFCVFYVFMNEEKRWYIPYGFAYDCPDDD
ncbi:MAG: hypothetical protein HQK86_15410 [Nitrospinae bacterium]|nr:hypothetical protein [Nitrospinota bacterium]MBF0634538.1 hypothetical protein [Nitrospinota bacterium]